MTTYTKKEAVQAKNEAMEKLETLKKVHSEHIRKARDAVKVRIAQKRIRVNIAQNMVDVESTERHACIAEAEAVLARCRATLAQEIAEAQKRCQKIEMDNYLILNSHEESVS